MGKLIKIDFRNLNNKRNVMYKNKLIGYLILGFSDEDIENALKKFRNKVNPLFRTILINRINEHHNNNVLVFVVTASPTFAVKACLSDFPVHVIGADYKKELDKYSSQNLDRSCYGKEKVNRIIEWQKNNNEELKFIESWSDSFSDYPMAILAKNRFWIGNHDLKEEMESKDPNGRFIFS